MKYLIDTNILLEILPINYRARVHKKKQQLMTPSLRSDKGTMVRHKVFEAGAIFSSASVNGWARLFALTPFVPLSREAGEGDYGVRKRSFRPR